MSIKKWITIFFLLTAVFSLNGCLQGGKDDARKIDEEFVGKWQCGEHPLETEEYYTGFLNLRIEEDGSFRMYDGEAGNPGISGRMDVISDQQLNLNCNTEDDFDPPPTWTHMDEKQTVEYYFTEAGELHLVLVKDESKSTLVFSRTEQ